MPSVLAVAAFALVAGLVLCHFTGISFWWAVGLAALAPLLPLIIPFFDFGDDNDSLPGSES